jgi:hypothetical protein
MVKILRVSVEVFTSTNMNKIVFWNVTSCVYTVPRLENSHLRFKGCFVKNWNLLAILLFVGLLTATGPDQLFQVDLRNLISDS